MTIAKTLQPLNGFRTHPLSAHALGELRAIARAPIPAQELNPGVRNRLMREFLIELVSMKSPYKVHKGGTCEHVRITDAGIVVLNTGVGDVVVR